MNGQMQMRLIGIPNGPVVRWAMSAAMAALGVVFSLSSVSAAETSAPLLVGEGVVDISPPLGTALGDFTTATQRGLVSRLRSIIRQR